MKGKIIGLLLAVSLLLPGAAGAQAVLDCWLEVPDQTAPGNAKDGPTQEYVNARCRNKGDATATVISCNFKQPNGVNLNTAPGWAPNAGTIGVTNTIYSLEFDVQITSAKDPGDIINWGMRCTYNDGTDPQVERSPATTEVVKKPKRKIVHDYAHEGVWHPRQNKLLFMDYNSRDIAYYDADNDITVKLTYDDSTYCDSHPVWTRDGKKVVWQRTNDETSDNYSGSIWIINADGTGARPVLDQGPDAECWAHPNTTPDGRIVARIHTDENFDGNDVYDWGAIWYIVNQDGTGLTRVVKNPHQHYLGHSDVSGNFLLLRGGEDQYYTTHNLMVFDYTVPEGEAIALIGGNGPTNHGDIRPGYRTLVYKDGMDEDNDAPLYKSKFDGSKRECLTCRTRVQEYQLSDDALDITLDYGDDGIVEIEEVVKASAPDGTNFWTQNIAMALYDRTITLSEPLSKNPAGRVKVLVTYTYVPESCYFKPHYNRDGQVISYAYGHNQGSYQDTEVYIMRHDGKNKQRLSFWSDSDTYTGGSHSLPAISSSGKYMAYNDNDCCWDYNLTVIELPETAWKMVGTSKRDDDDDDDDDPWCIWTIAGGGVSNIFNTMLVIIPLLAGLGLRGLIRSRRKF